MDGETATGRNIFFGGQSLTTEEESSPPCPSPPPQSPTSAILCGQLTSLTNLRALEPPEWCNADVLRQASPTACEAAYVTFPNHSVRLPLPAIYPCVYNSSDAKKGKLCSTSADPVLCSSSWPPPHSPPSPATPPPHPVGPPPPTVPLPSTPPTRPPPLVTAFPFPSPIPSPQPSSSPSPSPLVSPSPSPSEIEWASEPPIRPPVYPNFASPPDPPVRPAEWQETPPHNSPAADTHDDSTDVLGQLQAAPAAPPPPGPALTTSTARQFASVALEPTSKQSDSVTLEPTSVHYAQTQEYTPADESAAYKAAYHAGDNFPSWAWPCVALLSGVFLFMGTWLACRLSHPPPLWPAHRRAMPRVSRDRGRGPVVSARWL